MICHFWTNCCHLVNILKFINPVTSQLFSHSFSLMYKMLRCFYLYVFFSSWKTTIILESFDKFLCILETRWNTPYWILLENHHNWILNTFFTLFSVTFLTRPFLYWIDSLKLLNLKFLPQGVQGPWFFIQPLFLLDQHLQKWYDQLIMEKNKRTPYFLLNFKGKSKNIFRWGSHTLPTFENLISLN